MRSKPFIRATIVASALGTAGVTAHATDWLQFGYDAAHSGFNAADTGYSTPTGNSILFHYSLPSAADSAPLYLGNVSTASGTKNLLFIVTKNGTLLALDADANSQTVIWSKSCVPPPSPAFNYCTKLTTGSPIVVFDPDTAVPYVYAYALDGKVHKYLAGDGTETVTCSPSTPTDYNCWPEVSTLKPDVEKGAAALSTAVTSGGTYLYSVTDGYIGDGGDYQGHITTINLATGVQTVFNSECSDLTYHFVENGTTSGGSPTDCASKQNGIWGRPGAIYDPGTNRVFITTGNGPYNASTGGLNWGDSVLALNPDGSGSGGGMPVDSYTPTTYGDTSSGLQGHDADLGSVSVALVPAPPGTAAAYLHIGVQPGKDGCVRLINLADMSGQGGPAHTGGELDAQNLPGGSNCSNGGDGPEIKPQPAVWVNPADSSSWIYVMSYGNGSAAYKIVLDGAGKPSLSQQWTANSGTSPVVANGTVYFMSGNHMQALDAVTGVSVQTSGSPWLTTSYGGQHWQSPILVNRRLYAVDNSGQLWVFALNDGIFRDGFQ